jgi:CheY-like chemotaxis protein
MAVHPKLQKMIQSALRQSSEECSLLLNQELVVTDTEGLMRDKAGYLCELEDSAFVVPVESRDDYSGNLFMIFSLRDAILMSGILLGIPPARISEKRKLLILEADDIDAFSEIANQIIGSFNSVLQPCLPHKVHLKQLPPNKFVPQMDKVTEEIPIPEGDYQVFKAQVKLGGEDLSRYDILVPSPLANLFEYGEAKEICENEEADAVQDQAESLRRLFPSDSAEQPEGIAAEGRGSAGEIRTVLVLEDDEKERERLRGLLVDNGFNAVTSHLGADMKRLFVDQSIRAAVIGIARPEEWELSLCTRVMDVCGDPRFPIIMCANQWTRIGVLKAVKNGAKDIMVKPYNEKDLLEKLTRFSFAA